MPYPATHLRIGLHYAEQTNLNGENLDLFLIGKLLADIKIKGELERKHTHYYSDKNYLDKQFVDDFLKVEYLMFRNGKPNFLMIGYLLHLLVDEYFIEQYKLLGMEKEIWNFKRKFNAIIDIGDNIIVFEKLNHIKNKTNLIRLDNIPTVFQSFDINKIRNEFKNGINTTIKEMSSNLIDFQDMRCFINDMELDIERNSHIDKCNLALSEFNKIMFNNGFIGFN